MFVYFFCNLQRYGRKIYISPATYDKPAWPCSSPMHRRKCDQVRCRRRRVAPGPSPSVQVGGWWEGSEAKVSEIGEEERGRERGQRHHAHAAAVASPPEIWFESRPPSLARSRRLTLTCGQRRRGVGRRDHCPVRCCCRMIFYQNAES